MPSDKPKKRKRQVEESTDDNNLPDTSKPTAIFTPTGRPRRHTLSIALPGSFLYNAHSFDLKNTLAGQIARALAVFCVDEVVIFDDEVRDNSVKRLQYHGEQSTPPNDLLALLLSYLETPPHMRKRLFPMNPDLQKAGLLPSLDMPHHLRRDEWCQYRDGVTIGKASTSGSTLVDVGTGSPVQIDVEIPANIRVTIKYSTMEPTGNDRNGTAVAPSAPREEAGWYWGYEVRQASSLSAVFTECPWEGGYDASIGTSERGIAAREMLKSWSGTTSNDQSPEVATKVEALRNFSHLLLVFGGHQGLEVATRNDEELGKMGATKPEELFDWWVNLVPNQGSRTIRTEEAVWVGLMATQDIINARKTM